MSWTKESMEHALQAVQEGSSVKAAAAAHEITRVTLLRRVRGTNKVATGAIQLLGSVQPVFSEDMENELAQHLLDMETRLFGLSTRDVRSLAFQLATKNNIRNNFNNEKQLAGKNWLSGFMARHP